jgi:hypothetical protein
MKMVAWRILVIASGELAKEAKKWYFFERNLDKRFKVNRFFNLQRDLSLFNIYGWSTSRFLNHRPKSRQFQPRPLGVSSVLSSASDTITG